MSDEPTNPGLPPETPMDAGSQALSEALHSSFAIVKFVMGLLLLVFIASGFFTVGPQQRAILLRFGKPVGGEAEKALLGPGFHWSFPYPIDESVLVSISGIQQVRSTVGWYAVTPAQEAAGTEPLAGMTLNPAQDGYVLTADGNIVHTRATLTYRINYPIRYTFDFLNASNAVQNALDSALIFAASHFAIDDILTRDVLGFREAVRRRVVDLVDRQGLGVAIEQCSVQSVPPRQVKEAFAEVLKAEVGRSKTLNDARSYENQVLSKASADSQGRINLAESDRARLIQDVRSQAERFNDLLPKFAANPKLFVEQRLTETLGRVLTNVQDKIFVTESGDANRKELRYLFNREPVKPKTEESK